jgi:hypothetical protein
MLPADVPDQIPHPCCDLARQRPSSVLRYPNQKQVDFEYGVRAPTTFRHSRSLSGAHALKSRRLKATALTLPVRDEKRMTGRPTDLVDCARLEEAREFGGNPE